MRCRVVAIVIVVVVGRWSLSVAVAGCCVVVVVGGRRWVGLGSQEADSGKFDFFDPLFAPNV